VARTAVPKSQQLLDACDPRAETGAVVAKATSGMATLLAVQERIQKRWGASMTD